MKGKSVKAASVSAVGSRIPPQCLHIIIQSRKVFSRSLTTARTTNASPVYIIAKLLPSIFGTWTQIYSFAVYGAGYQYSPPVLPDGVIGLPVEPVSVEPSSSKWDMSEKSQNKFSIVKKSDVKQGTITYKNKN